MTKVELLALIAEAKDDAVVLINDQRAKTAVVSLDRAAIFIDEAI